MNRYFVFKASSGPQSHQFLASRPEASAARPTDLAALKAEVLDGVGTPVRYGANTVRGTCGAPTALSRCSILYAMSILALLLSRRGFDTGCPAEVIPAVIGHLTGSATKWSPPGEEVRLNGRRSLAAAKRCRVPAVRV